MYGWTFINSQSFQLVIVVLAQATQTWALKTLCTLKWLLMLNSFALVYFLNASSFFQIMQLANISVQVINQSHELCFQIFLTRFYSFSAIRCLLKDFKIDCVEHSQRLFSITFHSLLKALVCLSVIATILPATIYSHKRQQSTKPSITTLNRSHSQPVTCDPPHTHLTPATLP